METGYLLIKPPDVVYSLPSCSLELKLGRSPVLSSSKASSADFLPHCSPAPEEERGGPWQLGLLWIRVVSAFSLLVDCPQIAL